MRLVQIYVDLLQVLFRLNFGFTFTLKIRLNKIIPVFEAFYTIQKAIRKIKNMELETAYVTV